jgi:5'-nucleotidase
MSFDLSSARILISNDDGINAPGIKVLERIARSLSKDVWVVAPETEQSAAGHSLTIRRPLRVRKYGPKRFSVDGTPTDAVLLGVNTIIKGKRPDLVLSGINRGANLGEDVTYSGTVAAAMEGVILGIPSIALSQCIFHNNGVQWHTCEHWGAQIIRQALSVEWGANILVNVNFPDCRPEEVNGIKVVRQGKRKIGDDLLERLDPRGEPYIWIGAQRAENTTEIGTDIEAAFNGAIAITPLNVDLTHHQSMALLKTVFHEGGV